MRGGQQRARCSGSLRTGSGTGDGQPADVGRHRDRPSAAARVVQAEPARAERDRADGLLDLAGRRPPGLPEPAQRRVRHRAGRRRLDPAFGAATATSTRRAASCRRTATAAPSMRAAQGTVCGNGVGVVVLKRLADALARRRPIHAVIRGSAVNNDGAARSASPRRASTGRRR